jgi:hypothetical protein
MYNAIIDENILTAFHFPGHGRIADEDAILCTHTFFVQIKGKFLSLCQDYLSISDFACSDLGTFGIKDGTYGIIDLGLNIPDIFKISEMSFIIAMAEIESGQGHT